jgi:hypothetical protein
MKKISFIGVINNAFPEYRQIRVGITKTLKIFLRSKFKLVSDLTAKSNAQH